MTTPKKRGLVGLIEIVEKNLISRKIGHCLENVLCGWFLGVF